MHSTAVTTSHYGIGTFSVSGQLIGATIFAATVATQAPIQPKQAKQIAAHGWYYEHATQNSTFQTVNISKAITPQEFVSAVTGMYDKLISAQRDLEPEMAKILYSNLWNLYE